MGDVLLSAEEKLALAESTWASLPALTCGAASPAVKDLEVVIVGGSIGGLAAANCLKAAGFSKVRVFERGPPGTRAGAGVGVDDAAVAVFKGLGLTKEDLTLQVSRYHDERVAGDVLLQRQAYPYWSSRYVEVAKGLLSKVPELVAFNKRGLEVVPSGSRYTVKFLNEDQEESKESDVEADVVIACDGPRSSFRHLFYDERETVPSEFMRYAGYFAWRGTVAADDLPKDVHDALYEEMPTLGNSIQFLHCKNHGNASGVLYDIGKGVLNWLVYENRAVPPGAESGKTTSDVDTADRSVFLEKNSVAKWGPGFGGLIQATPAERLFRTDVYDLKDPLPRLAKDGLAILGDAAHAITPHVAKGSNMAVHDAYALAVASNGAATKEEWLSTYSAMRLEETANTVAFSKHMGRLRQGLLENFPHDREPRTESEYVARVLSNPALEGRTLPAHECFDAVWAAQKPPVSTDAFFTVKFRPLPYVRLNHCSRETTNLNDMIHFYGTVLGLKTLPRPNFGFGGIWYELMPGIALHIIVRDPAKGPLPETKPPRFPESFIRRDNHIALTVTDIDLTKKRLANFGIKYAVNSVPDTTIEQLFVYDPEGYGTEIGNFDQPQSSSS